MPNTYTQLYIHTVFAVKYQHSLIQPHFIKQLFSVIGNLLNETGCQTIIVNGVEDHVHCFFRLKSTLSLSDVMKSVKAKSSKWVNESKLHSNRFEWQKGFGGFSYHPSMVNKHYSYIENQSEHHRLETFRNEYMRILKEFNVEYNQDYWFEELI